MRLSGHQIDCVRGGRAVFSGLDFAAASGRALAVVGPNGSGKTSLLRLVAGLSSFAARRSGALFNALAIALFALTVAAAALAWRRRHGGRNSPPLLP